MYKTIRTMEQTTAEDKEFRDRIEDAIRQTEDLNRAFGRMLEGLREEERRRQQPEKTHI